VRTATLLGGSDRGGTGLFDEDFFMYGEDLDLCYRIQKAGWKIYYTPSTQIIHYKGESTKKGEVRYVRLFYGAMVLFTQKHLQDRYSMSFAAILQASILVRAGLSLAMRAVGRLAPPLVDFGLVFGVVGLFGFLRSQQLGAPFDRMFLTVVAPAYGAGTVVGVFLARGYRGTARPRVRPALVGILTGFLVISAASFFAKSIAFSRAVVLASFPVSALFLCAWRLLWERSRRETRRAIVVGDREEAERLASMIRAHPRPPFRIDGFVEDREDVVARGGQGEGVHLLGALHHLRDLVRLHRVDDVVFAVKTLSNRRILSIMQSLRDLSVQFRMLGEDRSHVIGKANVSQLGLPDWSKAVSEAVTLRSRASRRAFEVPVAALLLLVSPILRIGRRIAPASTAVSRLALAAALAPAVLRGRKDLVGLDPSHGDLVPGDWQLREGVFNVTELLHRTEGIDPSDDDLTRAYWFYVTHQSTGLDAEIIFRGSADR
jgi:CoA-binding protein